jgi:hypothetical protein
MRLETDETALALQLTGRVVELELAEPIRHGTALLTYLTMRRR